VRLTLFFFNLSQGLDDGPSFLGCVIFDQTLFSHSIIFSITCTSVTGGIIMKRQLQWWSIITRDTNKRETCCTAYAKVSQRL